MIIPSYTELTDVGRFCSLFNLLDLPALVFPVTQVDPSKDTADSNFKALSEEDAKFHSECRSDAPSDGIVARVTCKVASGG